MEIDPQKNLPYYYPAPQFTPCGPWISSYDRLNPWQVIWNNTYFAPDPYQQMFNFQDNRYGPGLGRRNYLLDPNKNYSLTIQQSGEYAYFTYGGFYDTQTGTYVPIEYIGPTISNVSGSDIGVTGWFDYVRDYPSGLYNNNSKYLMKIKRNVPAGTEIIMSVFDGQETINYYSRIEVPTFSITSTTEEDTLLHYYSREIEFLLDFQKSSGSCQLDGYGGAYPVGIKFYVEIVQGQAYGNLYYPGTVAEPEQSGILISDLEEEDGVGITNYSIRYKADGLQPDSLTPGTVTIRCSSNDLDIAPLEVSFPVKYNEDPPDEGGYIIVGMDKQSYEPGDRASINCKWLTGYNELVDFPAEQSFNVMITGGGEFGMLLDPNTGVIADNLLGVNNGFKVITATSIPYDSVVIRIKVSTSMGGNSASRMITNQNPKSEIKESNTVDIDDNTEILTPDISIGDPGQDIEGFGDVIVKKDECDEEIVVCNNYQPPKFEDVGTITVLGENDPWEWIDSQGTMQIISSFNGCNIIKAGEMGITYIMNAIGDPAISQQQIYYSLDDMKVTACADKSNSNPNDHIWRFSVENMRVPIFRDHCPSWTISNGYKDLLDGDNADTLAKYITNCNDYSNVMAALDWWKKGPYSQTISLPYLYYFSAGAIAHENIHVKQMKDGGTKAFSVSSLSQVMNGPNGLPKLAKYDKYYLNVYKCPEDVLNALWGKGSKVIKLKEQLRNELNNALEIASKLKPLGGVDGQLRYYSELEADELARPKYDEIKKNIENWAKQQNWWCIESIGGSFNCDGNKCK